jgi:hypothetical protein
MKNFKKAIVGLALAAVMAFSAVVVSSAPAHAQPLYGADPISQWIVLGGLFAPGYTNGTVNSGYHDPISQWIVLSGLFGYGY